MKGMTVPIAFTREENGVLLASLTASLQLLEQAEVRVGLPHGRAWSVLNSLRTLFAENEYGLERERDVPESLASDSEPIISVES